MSRQKAIGTRFESAFTVWMRDALGDERVERAALHGNADMGDVHGLFAHGLRGIAECKCHKAFSPSSTALIDGWFTETFEEKCNADADFALLVVHVPGVGVTSKSPTFGNNLVYVQLSDLMALSMQPEPRFCGERWVSMRLRDVAALMTGDTVE